MPTNGSTRRASLLTLAATATLVSCATLRQLSFERPSVELDTVEIVGLGLDGVSLVPLLRGQAQ